MTEITAAAVNTFRKRTGLPMMECKKALQEAGGDEEIAIEILRKAGKKSMEKRSDRETDAGRIAIFQDPKTGVTAMVELLCESAPVANTDEFILLVNAMAQQLAEGPGANTPDELLAQPWPGKKTTLQYEYDDLVNKIREVFRLTRMVRIQGQVGGYVHHNAGIGVLTHVEGDNLDLARDICMHVASMKPKAVRADDLDPAVIEKERRIITEEVQENNADKPEHVRLKMVEGRVKSFIAESCLMEQAFVKEMKKTVSQVTDEGKIKIQQVVHWVLGQK